MPGIYAKRVTRVTFAGKGRDYVELMGDAQQDGRHLRVTGRHPAR